MDFHVFEFLQEGMTDSECIKECIETANQHNKNKRVIFNRKDWLIDEAILVSSDMEIVIDGCTIKQNDYVFDNIFRGVNLKVNDDDPYGKPEYVTPLKNITIKGYNNARIAGCDRSKTGYHPVLNKEMEMVGDNWGWRTILICISNCENIEITGLNIYQTKCWAISLDFCSYCSIHDIHIESDVKNGDGIDLRIGCHHVRIWNITGSTSDDTVACTALFHSRREYPHKNYLYPLAPMGAIFNGSKSDMDIHDVLISDIRTGGLCHGVICLAADGLQVYNIDIKNIEDVKEGRRTATVMLYTGYGENYSDNDLHDIRISGIHSRFSKYAVSINTKVNNVTISDMIQENPEGSLYEFTNPEGITIIE